MDTATKAKELLAEIDRQIADAEKSLKALRAQRIGIARLVNVLSGTRRGRKPARITAGRGRPIGKRTRTDWNKVIAKFKGAFTLDDLAKASGKAKPTVNQAVQIMKKAGKIKSTGKRGEYQRTGAAAKAAKPKISTKKMATKKVAKKKVAKKKAAPKVAGAVTAPKEEGEEG